jgi:predicted TIM-barrel fold metal-dependent hydrolase
MAKQGVEKCLLYPAGMALCAEHYCDDTAALYANLRSFNRWYDDEWGFDRDGKIFAVGLLSLRDLDAAVAETDALIEAGARVVLLPTGPAYGRSPGDPYFDAVWSRLNEGGVTLALHIMPFWYFDAISPAWGHDPNPGAWHMSAWQWNNIYGERPVEDTLSALIYDNVFGRHPNLRVVVSEHGAEWVPHFVRHMDKSRS